MRYSRVTLFGAVAGLSAAIAACDQPEWRGLSVTEAVNGESHPQSSDPLPQPPAWLQPLQGQPLRAGVSKEVDCKGNAENVALIYAGQPNGVRIAGWAWGSDERAPPPRILIVDSSARIVGGGETGLERLDVPTALPEVTSNYTGWWALTSQLSGSVEVYGLMADGKSICRVGKLDL